jgi:hypothetical protein
MAVARLVGVGDAGDGLAMASPVSSAAVSGMRVDAI